MRLAVWLNARDDLVATQTTAMLLGAAARAGHAVWACGVTDLTVATGGVARAAAVPVPETGRDAGDDLVQAIRTAEPSAIVLDDCDQVWIRTNPARDAGRAGAHEAALAVARLLRARGTTVINDPDGLAATAGKLALLELPAGICPPTCITSDAAAAAAFVRELGGPAVVKPLRGTRGADVVRVEGPDDATLAHAWAAAPPGEPLMVQGWAAGGEDGDTRLVVLDGALLRVDGHPAAIARRPAPGDFRSNLHAGGRAERPTITPAMEHIVAVAGPWLAARGIRLAGLDVVGEHLIEANVYSTGGLRPAEGFFGVDFAGAVVERLCVPAGGPAGP